MGFKIVELYADLGVKDARYMAGMKRAEQYALRLKAGLASVSRVAQRVFLGIAAYAGVALYAFAKQEEAERLLDATLRSTGQSVDQYGLRLRRAASAMQGVTTYGDEFILSLMAQGMNLGVTADKIEQVTRDSIGLATALKMDLGTAMRYVALAQMGEMTMLRRYIPELRTVTDVTQQLAIVQAKAAAGWAQAKEEAQTFGGSLKQIKNMLGDVAEALGKGLLPHIVKFRDEIRRLLPALILWVKQNAEIIAQKALFVAKLALWALAISKAITLILGLAAAFQMLGAAIGMVAAAKTGAMVGGPIGGVVGLVVGIGAAIWGYQKLTSEARKFREELSKLTTPDLGVEGMTTAALAETTRAKGLHVAEVARRRDALRKQLREERGQLARLETGKTIYADPAKHTATMKNLKGSIAALEDTLKRLDDSTMPRLSEELARLTSSLKESKRLDVQKDIATIQQYIAGPPSTEGAKPEREGPQFLDPASLWRKLQESVFGQGRELEGIEKNTKGLLNTAETIADRILNINRGPVVT